ncbi:N-acetyltransferase [Clostridium sp. D33t1_170424_F3]|uniref:GNAT family N-acetyltransferase n=1 Tax=Clostridium sp. D33t1_170424_F3 TaxID=2787099 RepID=UPI0018AAA7B2|nr:N-acetyltransferase [Clostridium sp. D33t1_170424_F3]
MEYTIWEMRPAEYPLLEDFLYEAIFQRDAANRLPREIINGPALQQYIRNFGKQTGDYCLCAEVNQTVVGAVWVRIIPGYGSVDSQTPEFAVSLVPEYRGRGIGTDLMRRMLLHLKDAGYAQASLAVQKDNYALRMYLAVGFQIAAENKEEYIMVHHLEPCPALDRKRDDIQEKSCL